MARGVRVAERVRLRAVELVEQGRSASWVARELGVGRSSVTDWARAAGVELVMGARGGSLRAWQERRWAVLEAAAAGVE
ncbi:helix-turn-helix domain-containing protein, partial [Actinomyces sp. MRS3W]|nr:helix-turn-helix domain-containing protein [Actinomyces sp. MRS3W]